MSVLVDTSVIIDVLRGNADAAALLRSSREAGPLHASMITRLEVLAGMRPREAAVTRTLLDSLLWHPLDEQLAEVAGELGRKWLPGNHGIDTADLVIAATAMQLNARLLTRNTKHFPMFPELATPYD